MGDVPTTAAPAGTPATPAPSGWQSVLNVFKMICRNWHIVVLLFTAALSAHNMVKHSDTAADVAKIKQDIYQVPSPPAVPPAAKDEPKKAEDGGGKKNAPSAPAKLTVHVSFVTDPTISPEVNAVLNDQSLAKWLLDHRLNGYHVLTSDRADVVNAAKAAGIVPAIVQQDASGAIVAVTPLTTSDAAKKAISPYVK